MNIIITIFIIVLIVALIVFTLMPLILCNLFGVDYRERHKDYGDDNFDEW